MKSSRHKTRLKIVQNLYAYEINKHLEDLPNKDPEVLEKTNKVLQKKDHIDSYIKKYATRLPFEKIAKVDLSILRLGIYELLWEKDIPEKVAIDEAVNLAKELGAEKSYAFVNAILEKVFKNKK